MNKKGFTLIEIIISLSLIVIIGITATVMVVNHNKNKEIRTLKQYNEKLENALNVYIENHPEIMNNLNDTSKAAIVTLEVLKNDGLIKDDLEVNYKNEYFLLSNMRLLDDNTEENINNADCENDVVSIEVFKKWDLTEKDGNKVMYVCPKDNITDLDDKLDYIITETDQLKDLVESLHGHEKTYFRGNDANNYLQINGKEFRIISYNKLGGADILSNESYINDLDPDLLLDLYGILEQERSCANFVMEFSAKCPTLYGIPLSENEYHIIDYHKRTCKFNYGYDKEVYPTANDLFNTSSCQTNNTDWIQYCSSEYKSIPNNYSSFISGNNDLLINADIHDERFKSSPCSQSIAGGGNGYNFRFNKFKYRLKSCVKINNINNSSYGTKTNPFTINTTQCVSN